MLVLKAVRLVLVALVALLAIPAATVHAAQRMPIGFFDDPSFRWSADARAESAAAPRPSGASVIHTTATWAAIAPTRPANRLQRRRSRVQAHRPRRSRLPGRPLRPARDDQHHRHAEVGERRQDAERHAEEARRPDDVREDARDALQRTAPGTGSVALWSVWNEPNLQLFLTPQYVGKKIVGPANYAKLYKAAYAGIKAGNPLAQGRDRRDVGARPRQAAADGAARPIAPGHVRAPALAGEGAASSTRGRIIRIRRRRICRRRRRCATRT